MICRNFKTLMPDFPPDEVLCRWLERLKLLIFQNFIILAPVVLCLERGKEASNTRAKALREYGSAFLFGVGSYSEQFAPNF